MKVRQSTPSSRKRLRLAIKLLAIAISMVLISLYVLNASKPGSSVEGCLEDCGIPAERKRGPLRVLSLNMLHGFPAFKNLDRRVDLIAQEIRRVDADVVLLQEVPWSIRMGNVAKDLSTKLGYNYVFYRANGNRRLIFFEEGEAIISRFALEDPVYTELKPRMNYFEHRVALRSTAATPWGVLSLFVTHLTDKDPTIAEGQAEALMSFVEAHTSGEAVVAGDFNSTEDTAQIKALARQWIDTYRVTHPGDPGFTCCVDNLNGGPIEPLEERIDYIFLVHPSGEIVSVEHVFYLPFQVGDGWQWVSDHTGLYLELNP